MTTARVNDLVSQMHAAAVAAQAAIDAIPEGVSVEEEMRRIKAAVAEPSKLAERIAEMDAADAHVVAAKALAAIWLDGSYSKLLQ